MWVYGDAERRERPPDMLARVAEAEEAAFRTAGVERHGWLVAALIEAGELAQGIADALFAGRGEVDDVSPEVDAAMSLACALAGRVARSWDTGFAEAEDGGAAAAARDRLLAVSLPELVTVRQPEGFAHYALYPEAYWAAARTVPRDPRLRVVGLRSIGTTLAAMTAAGLPDAPPPATLRPVGPPFCRCIAASRALAERIAPAGARVVIVDEGPGLSGSSIAAAGRFLRERDVADARIHVLPGHEGGPGPEADPETREFWRRVDRRVLSFDELVLRAENAAHRLERWFADLVGPATGPLESLSGQAWRARRFAGEAELPPVQAGQERLKFLMPTRDGPVLLRFAGLGRFGLGKLAMARRLHEAGFGPEPLGWRHGFLAERWRDDARPLDLRGDRAGIVRRVATYLAFRARAFPSAPTAGAPVRTLAEMLRHNARLAGLDARIPDEAEIAALERLRRPIAIDGRLHVWEWLGTPGGLLKADALDHHAGHDLIGPQDVSWDVAGAAIELGLSPAEADQLASLVRRASGHDVAPALLRLMRPCYAAFQLGAFTMAEAAEGDEPERRRLAAAVRRYRATLDECLT